MTHIKLQYLLGKHSYVTKQITCIFKRCECVNSSLIDVLSFPKLLVKFIGEYLPVSPCLLITFSLYSSSVFSANSVSSCCLNDFSELRSLSLKKKEKNFFSFLCPRWLWLNFLIQGNLSTTETLATEESYHSREVHVAVMGRLGCNMTPVFFQDCNIFSSKNAYFSK